VPLQSTLPTFLDPGNVTQRRQHTARTPRGTCAHSAGSIKSAPPEQHDGPRTQRSRMPPPTQSTSIGAMAGTAMGARGQVRVFSCKTPNIATQVHGHADDAGDAQARRQKRRVRTRDERWRCGRAVAVRTQARRQQRHKGSSTNGATNIPAPHSQSQGNVGATDIPAPHSQSPRRCHQYLLKHRRNGSSTDATQGHADATARGRGSAETRRRVPQATRGREGAVTEGATKEQRGITGKTAAKLAVTKAFDFRRHVWNRLDTIGGSTQL